jgi:hypothetical protein
MTLTIELTPAQQAVLEAQASSQGSGLPEFAKVRLLEGLPAPRAENNMTPAEVLSLWKAEACLGLFAESSADSTEIARQLRASAWKR